MTLAGALDRLANRVRRPLAKLTCPRSADLGQVGYSQRIRDRHQRWLRERQPHWSYRYSPKLAGCDYVRSLGYGVPETYGVFPSLADVPLGDLPACVVLKPQSGHSGRGVFVIRDGIDSFTGMRVTRDWMLREAGDNAARAYIAEELLVNFDGRAGAPLDYKFYCFGSRIAFSAIIERNTVTGSDDLNKFWFRTPEWKPLPLRFMWAHRHERGDPPKPPFLDELSAMASDLAGRFDLFVRVDLYATTRGPVFGEFTHFPAMGFSTTPLADLWLGSLWRGLEGCGDGAAAVEPPGVADQPLKRKCSTSPSCTS